jgi:hypothetical protein
MVPGPPITGSVALPFWVGDVASPLLVGLEGGVDLLGGLFRERSLEDLATEPARLTCRIVVESWIADALYELA